MRHFFTSLLFSTCLAQAASKIYTGFNYGAFWSVEANAKKKADFLDGFNLARNLTTGTPFDSARLFTCKQTGTLDEPTEAFDAAVISKTSLLLGFWITPGQKGGSPDNNVKNEMAALEKGFKRHGQALSDLVIGLSVGSEDVYRAEEAGEIGVTAAVVGQTIAQVKKDIAASSFAQYMKDKPVGHVDTAKYAVVDNADFIGMTAYPYWNKDSIETASISFQGSLSEVKQRAGNRPVWIAEIGWPSTDTEQHGAAVAGIDEVQKFWSEVGCAVFGKYTTFWFQLLKDTTPEQKADWSIMDTNSRLSRIKNMSCGNPQPKPPADSPSSSQTLSQPPVASIPPKMPTSGSSTVSSATPVLSSSESPPIGQSTTYVTITKTATVTPQPIIPSSAASGDPSFVTSILTLTSNTAAISQPLIEPSEIPIGTDWCVTVADIDRNGSPVPVDAGPAGADGECSVPPTYTGLPVAAPSTGDSKAPLPSTGPLPPTSVTIEFSLLSSIKAPASAVTSLVNSGFPLSTSSGKSQCKRREPRPVARLLPNSTAVVPVSTTALVSITLASPHAVTLARVPSGPFNATPSEFNFPTPTAVAETKVTVKGGERVLSRRNWFKDTWKKFMLWGKKTWNR